MSIVKKALLVFPLLGTWFSAKVALSLASVPLCDGWNEGSMQVTGCKIGGGTMVSLATFGNNFLFVSMLTLFVPLILVFILSFACWYIWLITLSAKIDLSNANNVSFTGEVKLYCKALYSDFISSIKGLKIERLIFHGAFMVSGIALLVLAGIIQFGIIVIAMYFYS